MGEVIIEVKYFNSFVLKKIAKVNHKFMTEPPYPGELETRLGGYGNATFRNKWGYQEVD